MLINKTVVPLYGHKKHLPLNISIGFGTALVPIVSQDMLTNDVRSELKAGTGIYSQIRDCL